MGSSRADKGRGSRIPIRPWAMMSIMSYDIRTIHQDEIEAFVATVETAFGAELRASDIPTFKRKVQHDRLHAAFDGKEIVGTAGVFPFTLTVPGAEISAAGITMVGVPPTHRRRGILRQLMRAQLDDMRSRGESIAILWASEDAIYQRFGYGHSADHAYIAADRNNVSFLDDPGPVGRARLVDRDERVGLLGPIYERVRRVTPGMYERSSTWWETHSLHESKSEEEGDRPLFCAVIEIDGVPDAYATYRVKQDWSDDGIPKGRVNVREVMATSVTSTREIWRYLFGIDLVERVHASYQPVDHPLYLMVQEPRRLRFSHNEILWLRIVDVAEALSRRGYATGDSLVVQITDEFCDWNDGTYLLDAGAGKAERSDRPPELRMRVAALAGPYLGGFTFSRLASAGRIEELAPGALERADAMFRTDRAPWCPENF